ncbi:hypothetical protein PFMALIP_00260 [Plasmodium falciparum MaliPS096_E11]|uniref:Uncharacterized protein n=1 Tax=Plasmodium falciparum MaliPS096_E11 TaxID=1036727 RepID=A0A024WXX3_PLAFA|nr:hypothetical protein PFMALIP_00260 [Plasmodium falciparum MaliPS096_E11]
MFIIKNMNCLTKTFGKFISPIQVIICTSILYLFYKNVEYSFFVFFFFFYFFIFFFFFFFCHIFNI